MSTRNINTQFVLRWVSLSGLLVWLGSAAALAQLFITVSPAEHVSFPSLNKDGVL